MTNERSNKYTGVLAETETLLREGITLEHLALAEGMQPSIARSFWRDDEIDAKRDVLVDRLIVRFKERRPFEGDRQADPEGYLLHTVIEDAAGASQRQFVRIGMAAMRAKERADETMAYATAVQAYYDCIMPWLNQGMTVGDAIEAYKREHPDTPLPEIPPMPDGFLEDTPEST